MVKNRNFGQKSKFWSKIEIWITNPNFHQKYSVGNSKLYYKTEYYKSFPAGAQIDVDPYIEMVKLNSEQHIDAEKEASLPQIYRKNVEQTPLSYLIEPKSACPQKKKFVSLIKTAYTS